MYQKKIKLSRIRERQPRKSHKIITNIINDLNAIYLLSNKSNLDSNTNHS